MMYHGLKWFAVYSRNTGTFGGKAANATVKIYRSNNANSPACTLDAFAQIEEFRGLISDCATREEKDAVMAEFVKFGG